MYLLGRRALTGYWPRRVRAGLEIALVLVLAVQAAQLVWIVLAPAHSLSLGLTASEKPNDRDLTILARFNPFAPVSGGAGTAAETVESDGQLNLFGVRADGKGGGSAIIGRPGAPQTVYSAGEEVAPGIVLKAIAADHVVLARGARTSRLALATPRAQGTVIPSYLLAPPPAAPAKPAPPVAVDPKKLIQEAGLLPRVQGGRVTGYTLFPRGGGDMLRSAGLVAGDVLVGLNGNQITPERYSELEQELTSSPQVQITVQRGAETKTITLQTGR